MLPIGVRCRQLSVRTLLAGMCLTQADGRPAHLTRARQALTSLPEDDQRRLGVITDWKNGPHRLTYRQAGYTFGLVADALAADEPGGQPSLALQAVCGSLLEASIPGGAQGRQQVAGRGLDRTWSPSPGPRPAKAAPAPIPKRPGDTARTTCCAAKMSCSAATACSACVMMREENGPAVPELARRATLSSCRHDPVRALVPVLTADAGRRYRARRHPRRFRLRPPRRRSLGHPAARRRRAARPGPPPPRPRPQGHPRRRHHRQRKPVLPPDAARAAGTRAARPQRHQTAGRRLGTPDR